MVNYTLATNSASQILLQQSHINTFPINPKDIHIPNPANIFCTFQEYSALTKVSLKDLTYKQLLTLIAMPLSSLIVSFAHVFLFTQTPSDTPVMSVANILSYLILISSNILVFQIVDTTYQNAEKEQQLFIVKELLSAQTNQYEQMQAQSQQILKTKHDYKNFLLGLISELENENYSASIDF